MNFEDLLFRVEGAPRHNPLLLRREDIPPLPGVYVWRSKDKDRPVYIGKATGSGGLRRRIWAQHLNPRYLEGRSDRIVAADSFQLSRAVIVRGQRVIDKSVFRRNIGRRERLAPGQPTVDYICIHFAVSWLTVPLLEAAAFERYLIKALSPVSDLYNRAGVLSSRSTHTIEASLRYAEVAERT
jgi:hypothetical protein